MKHDLHVENIKCSGCAHSIVTSLSKVKGVHQVTVDVENGSIQRNDNRNILHQLFDRQSDFLVVLQIW